LQQKFNADLIAEITSLCNRACVGCYAPNLISNQKPENVFEASPELFLDETEFENQLKRISTLHPVDSIALRGGEPSLHPKLPHLLKIAKRYSSTVYLETHGRWILEQSSYNHLLQACFNENIIIKISYDRMHGLSPVQLTNMIARLDEKPINWRLAVTESSIIAFEKTISEIQLDSEKVYFQQLATNSSELIQPKLGVIRRNGTWSNALTNHFEEKKNAIPLRSEL
jgi:uncharacterized Fe-S cluster-containing radical SAM superfamily protein